MKDSLSRHSHLPELLRFWIPGRASYRQLARNDGRNDHLHLRDTTLGDITLQNQLTIKVNIFCAVPPSGSSTLNVRSVVPGERGVPVIRPVVRSSASPAGRV